MPELCVIGPQGKCAVVQSVDLVLNLTAVYITASVGLNGVNRSEDVGVIQNALNRVASEMGGPTPQLVQDGICGPLTRRAIQRFQQRQFGWYDGRVDPAQMTLAKLNGIVNGPGTTSLVSPLSAKPTLLDKAEETITHAKLWVSKALASLLFARLLYTDSLSAPGIYSSNKRWVDTHFHLDKAIDPVTMIDKVQANYRLMNRALIMDPLFEADPTGEKEALAYASLGGFHSPGKTGPVGVSSFVTGRLDRIYICSAFDELGIKSSTAVVVHELGHFVGGSGAADTIKHFASELPAFDGKGVEGCPRDYAHLTPEEAIRNAASYGTFAIHAFYGFDNRAGWT